jgi:hypothetical protein
MLTFDSATHVYRYAGSVVPSVTQALRVLTDDYLLRIPSEILDRKRIIGASVDAAISLDAADNLDESSIDEQCAGYFRAWRRFRQEAGIDANDIGAIQAQRYHPRLRFAGTLDLELRINRRWAIVDVKCSYGLHPAVGPQTAAYLELAKANERDTEPVKDRYALHLKPDATYRLEPLTDPSDFGIFQSALNILVWKGRNL